MVAGEEDRAILNKQINNLTNQLLPTYLHVIATHHCWSMSGCYTVSGGGKLFPTACLFLLICPCSKIIHICVSKGISPISPIWFFSPLSLSFCPFCHSWIKAVLATPTLVLCPLLRGEERQAKTGQQLWVLGSCWLMPDEDDAPGRVSFGMVEYTCSSGLWTINT